VNFGDKSDWNIDLSQVRNVWGEVNDTYERLVAVTYKAQARIRKVYVLHKTLCSKLRPAGDTDSISRSNIIASFFCENDGLSEIRPLDQCNRNWYSRQVHQAGLRSARSEDIPEPQIGIPLRKPVHDAASPSVFPVQDLYVITDFNRTTVRGRLEMLLGWQVRFKSVPQRTPI
jgi:hypothetical protein